MGSKTKHDRTGFQVNDSSINAGSDLDAFNNDGLRYRPAISPSLGNAVEQDTISAVDVFKDDKIDNLSSHERRILEQQLSIPAVKVSYTMLYRYATKIDFLILIGSVLCAMASGVVMPLMTVSSLPLMFLE